MSKIQKDQRTVYPVVDETYLYTWLEAFLVDRKAAGLAEGTIEFYRLKLGKFAKFCDSLAISEVTQLTPSAIRSYLLLLQEKGHNAGGLHAFFWVVKNFLRWWENEIEPDGWKNPITKVKAPKVSIRLIEPVDIETIKAMISTCKTSSFYGARDKTIILTLMDTGLRAGELLAINLDGVEINGVVLVRKGKGGKPRTVFFERKTRQSIRSYLRKRKDKNLAMWVNMRGDRLTY